MFQKISTTKYCSEHIYRTIFIVKQGLLVLKHLSHDTLIQFGPIQKLFLYSCVK